MRTALFTWNVEKILSILLPFKIAPLPIMNHLMMQVPYTLKAMIPYPILGFGIVPFLIINPRVVDLSILDVSVLAVKKQIKPSLRIAYLSIMKGGIIALLAAVGALYLEVTWFFQDVIFKTTKRAEAAPLAVPIMIILVARL